MTRTATLAVGALLVPAGVWAFVGWGELKVSPATPTSPTEVAPSGPHASGGARLAIPALPRPAPPAPRREFAGAAPAGDEGAVRSGDQEVTVGPRRDHEFTFTRGAYSGGFGRRRGAWATDFPKAEQQFTYLVQRTLGLLDVDEEANPVLLDDPTLRRFPWLYMLEVGYMRLSDSEAEGLRSYLEAGGFLVVDDFWGTREWANFEYEMQRVFPSRPIVDLPIEHEIFRSFYNIEEILQVPAYRRGWGYEQTWERDGYNPAVRAILDDNGRVMVVINWNTDLGDAWEWAEQPDYPFEYSSFAYKLGVNYIVYAMTH